MSLRDALTSKVALAVVLMPLLGCGIGAAGSGDENGSDGDDIRKPCPDDGNACTLEKRVRQQCVSTPAPDGTACPGGACLSGLCVAQDAGAPPPPPPPPLDAGSPVPPDAGAGPDASTPQTVGMGPLKAFPGCEGAGCVSVGGRGGKVYVVNSLAQAYGADCAMGATGQSTGTCTLRDCVMAKNYGALMTAGDGAPGKKPRTCVFAVSGVIEIPAYLGLDYNEPYLSIAGQAAPGGGITLHGVPPFHAQLMWSSGHDHTIRYLRLRPGTSGFSEHIDEVNGPLALGDPSWAAGGGSPYNTEGKVWAGRRVVDHVSISNSGDDAFQMYCSFGGCDSDTVSWILIGEGGNSTYSFQNTAFIVGGAVQDKITNLALHHSGLIGQTHRLPVMGVVSFQVISNLTAGMENDAKAGGASGINGKVDVINNFIDAQGSRPYDIVWESNSDGFYDRGASNEPSLYVSGNASARQCGGGVCPDPWAIAWHADTTNFNVNGFGPCTSSSQCASDQACSPAGRCARTIPAAWRRSAREALPPALEITADPATSLQQLLLVGGRTVGPANYGPIGASRRLTCRGALVDDQDKADKGVIARYRAKSSFWPDYRGEDDPRYEATSSRWTLDVKPDLAARATPPCLWRDGLPAEWAAYWGDPVRKNAALSANGHHFDAGYTDLEAYLSGLFPAP